MLTKYIHLNSEAKDRRCATGVASKDLKLKQKFFSLMNEYLEVTVNEVSEALSISIPKSADIIATLISENFIKENGKRSVGKGRNASVYSLNTEGSYFLGVEIKKYKINIGLMGFDKSMIKSKLDIPFLYQEAMESLEEIIAIINNFVDEIKIDKTKIGGLGISMGGRINVRTGEILTIYHFSDAPVKAILEKELGLPVFIDNDSRTIAYGEFNFGKRDKEKDVLVLNLDYGMAIGIFVDGKPVYGASGYAGELSHIPLFDNEKICFCGKKGCLETEASGLALIRKIGELMENGSNSILQKILAKKGMVEIEDIIEAIEKGDNLTLQVVREVAEKLGRGLAITINIFNPELIIIGGSLSAIGEPLLFPLKTAIIEHSLNLVNSDTRVVISNLKSTAGLLGCCLLVRDKILGLVKF